MAPHSWECAALGWVQATLTRVLHCDINVQLTNTFSSLKAHLRRLYYEQHWNTASLQNLHWHTAAKILQSNKIFADNCPNVRFKAFSELCENLQTSTSKLENTTSQFSSCPVVKEGTGGGYVMAGPMYVLIVASIITLTQYQAAGQRVDVCMHAT